MRRHRHNTATGSRPHPWRRGLAAAATVLGLAAFGGVAATGAAAADPGNPTVDVVGRVTACGHHSFAVGIEYRGSTGDRGWAPVGRDGRYLIALHRVGWRGEHVDTRIDCAWRPPAHVGFSVERPRRGIFVGHDLD